MRPEGACRPRAAVPVVALALLASLGVLSACAPGSSLLGTTTVTQPVTGGDPERGRQMIAAYGCGSCHTIPGVPAANARVAPPLIEWGTRTTILGLVPNTPERLVDWIVAPESLRPGTTMPNVGVPEEDARQMAAYLYTLR